MNLETRRPDAVSIIACTAAFLSTAVHGLAFYIAQNIGERSGMVIYLCENGIGFTLSKTVWFVTIIANLLGVVGLVFLIASSLTRRPWPSLLNIAAIVFLLPTAYIVCFLLILLVQ